MKAVLIGGTGFIGSPLALVLAKQGHAVLSVARGVTELPADITSIQVDLSTQSIPETTLNQADVVFVLLGQNHRGFDAGKETHILTTLAQALGKVQARVVYCSSVMVYGQTERKAKESTPCQPVDTYATFKLEAENLLQSALNPHRLTILRLANIYGGPKNKGFIGHVLGKLDEPNTTIRLTGDGLQRRDFVFIDDLIDAILAVVEQPDQAGIVNIATGVSHSMIDVIETIEAVSGKKIQYEITHSVANEPKDSMIDNARLRQVFGYTDFRSLKAGLAQTLPRYQEQP